MLTIPFMIDQYLKDPLIVKIYDLFFLFLIFAVAIFIIVKLVKKMILGDKLKKDKVKELISQYIWDCKTIDFLLSAKIFEAVMNCGEANVDSYNRKILMMIAYAEMKYQKIVSYHPEFKKDHQSPLMKYKRQISEIHGYYKKTS